MKTFQSVDGHTIRSGMQVWVAVGDQLSLERVGVIMEKKFMYPDTSLNIYHGAKNSCAYACYENAEFKRVKNEFFSRS